MFRKYEKNYRIETDDFPVKGKAVLSDKEEKRLFKGTVQCFEKVDGGSAGIRKENGKVYLQKRGSDLDLSHYQYKFFTRWAYENAEKLMKLPDDIIIYGDVFNPYRALLFQL